MLITILVAVAIVVCIKLITYCVFDIGVKVLNIKEYFEDKR